MTVPTPRATATLLTASDTSSHQTFTPDYTPSSTPSRENHPTNLQSDIGMDETKVAEPVTKDDVKIEETEAKGENGKDTKPATAVDTKPKVCKRHPKGHKKSKRRSRKEALSDSDSSESTDSSCDSASKSETEDSDSSSSEDEATRKRKKKSRRKQKEKKSRKKSKKDVSSSEDSDSSGSSSSEEEVKQKRRIKKSKRSRRTAEDSADEDEDDNEVEQAQAQLKRLELRKASRLADRAAAAAGKKRRKKVKHTKKSSAKPQYFRADELWDQEIHAYKLTETAAAADKDEYGEYSFHVRRRFDWEGKYSDVCLSRGSRAWLDG